MPDSEPTLLCPTCATNLAKVEMCWLHQGKWYCSEQCCRKAVGA